MKTNKKIYAALIAALFTAGTLFEACNKDKGASPTSSTTTYNMYMTDAPAASYQQVNVNITGAMVNSSVSGWVSLAIRPGIYDLLMLSNGKDTLLANGQIAVGNVSQVRLILAPTGNSVMVNGTLYPLETPSAQQSGLKINVNNTLVAGITYMLTLDFDAGQSVVQTGNGSYILKPVIRAVAAASSGAIKGTITPVTATEIVAVSVSTPSDSLTTFLNTHTGTFLLQGVSAGAYNISILPLPPFTSSTYNNIAVSTGSVTDMGTISLH
jgi:hypothetical protein